MILCQCRTPCTEVVQALVSQCPLDTGYRGPTERAVCFKESYPGSTSPVLRTAGTLRPGIVDILSDPAEAQTDQTRIWYRMIVLLKGEIWKRDCVVSTERKRCRAHGTICTNRTA